MGSSEPKAPRAAFCYEVDEEGLPVSGTKRTARKKEEKEKPKVSHRRSEDKKQSKSDAGSSAGYGLVMASPRRDEGRPAGEIQVERRRGHAPAAASPSKSKRHSTSAAEHHKSSSKSKTVDQSYYGVPPSHAHAPTLAQPIPYRNRPPPQAPYPSRPMSQSMPYPAGSSYGTGPPLSNSAFFPHQGLPAQPPPPQHPPPSPSFIQYAAPSEISMGPSPVGTRPLARRFDPIDRTTSAFGSRDTVIQQARDTSDDGYASAAEGPRIRRPSVRIQPHSGLPRTKADLDYQAMPPPPRPASARPPGPGILRRSGEYHTDMPVAPQPQYRDHDERAVYRDELMAPRRRSTHRNSVSYEYPDHRIEPANSGRRRQSYYDSTSAGSGTSSASRWEDQAAHAATYQEDVGAAAPLRTAAPLTEDLLHRQQFRQGGSSRSTKSSGSRDDSDYRQSATTRTTRSVSSPDDENITIKVTGQARVVVSGAQIDCDRGGEIEIKRQKSIKNGSEWSNSEYGGGQRRIDDRASRVDRPSGRSRRSSVSAAPYQRSTQYHPEGFF